MAEQDLLHDDLRSLDLAAEERGAAALGTFHAAVGRMRSQGDRHRLVRALPPLARAAEDPILQVRIANTLGTVLDDIGRLSGAVQIFEDGPRAARGFQAEAVVLRLRSNLSLALGRGARCRAQRPRGRPSRLTGICCRTGTLR